MSRTIILDREELGKEVRRIWVDYCYAISDFKPSHIAPWEELSEEDKEADRVIGEQIAEFVREKLREKAWKAQPCSACGKLLPKWVAWEDYRELQAIVVGMSIMLLLMLALFVWVIMGGPP